MGYRDALAIVVAAIEEKTGAVIDITNLDNIESSVNSAFTGINVAEDTDTIITYNTAAVNNTQIRTAAFGRGLSQIAASAFSGNTVLVSITIPPTVTNIGSSAFSGCTSLNNVVIPGSVLTVDSYAFDGCTGLANLTITPNGNVANINAYSFRKCGITGSFEIPDTVTSIGTYAFSNCDKMTSIKFPNAIETLPDYGIPFEVENDCRTCV